MTQNESVQTSYQSLSSKNYKLLNEINKLYQVCFSEISSDKIYQKNSTKLLQRLNNIQNNYTQNQLKNLEPNKILSCAVKVLSLSDENFYKSNKIYKLQHSKNYKVAKLCYYNILNIFITTRKVEIINIVIEVMHQESFWRWEDLCCDLIYGLVDNGIDVYNIVDYLLNEAMEERTNFRNAKLIIRILIVSILDNYSWPNTNETKKIVEKFLQIFRSGINYSTILNERNKFLKRSIYLCLCQVINNLSEDYRYFIIYQLCSWTIEENIDDNTIVKFSSLLEYAANFETSNLLENTLTDKLFILLMRMIASTNALVSLLGNRVFQNLIDRRKNRSQFESPQIFLENAKYNININNYNEKDKDFLKKYREIFHDTFVTCMMNHSLIRLNLECMYCTICLIAVEIPCGFTAAALVCLIMNVQKFTLGKSNVTQGNSNHIHAIIMAIMSLICWIHQAKVLYSHVNQVMMERAQWAPHLNPPLKIQYSYAVHHVHWNKPENFFVNWEIRFGLWKCFHSHIDNDNNDHSKIIEQ